MIYGLVTGVASVLPLLQEQDMQEQALIQQVRDPLASLASFWTVSVCVCFYGHI